MDCRISAYNAEKKKKDKTIDLILVDLDQSNFKSKRELERAKTKTLSKISMFNLSKDSNNKSATVLWSGNGYHLYIPSDSKGKISDQTPNLKKLTKDPSKEFLRFAESYLSNGKSDNAHNNTVSFNNCMLRVPGSFNSKNNVQVRIVEKWDGITKVRLDLLYGQFLAYLMDNKNICKKKYGPKTNRDLLEDGNLSKLDAFQRFYQSRIKKKNKNKNNNKNTHWIERLLSTPIPNHRKYCIWRIFAPYFINVKHLSYDDSYDRIHQWLRRCDKLRKLDFDPETKINDSLNRVTNTRYLPISLDDRSKEPRTLKTDNRELYNIIKAYVRL